MNKILPLSAVTALTLTVGLMLPGMAQELRPALPETEAAQVNPLPDEVVKEEEKAEGISAPEEKHSFKDDHGVVTDTAKTVGKGVEAVGKGAVEGVGAVGKGVGKGAEKVGKGAVVGVEAVGKGAEKVGKGAVVGVEAVGKGVEKLGKGLVDGIKKVGGGGGAKPKSNLSQSQSLSNNAPATPAPQVTPAASAPETKQSPDLEKAQGWE